MPGVGAGKELSSQNSGKQQLLTSPEPGRPRVTGFNLVFIWEVFPLRLPPTLFSISHFFKVEFKSKLLRATLGSYPRGSKHKG